MNTEVMHLRARASGVADSAALRQLATGWLAQLQPQDHGLPHDAIVLVRQLRAQADAGPGPRGPAWRAAADQAWAHTLAGAARLGPGQAAPAAAAAVWFAGPVELLVNLLHDLAQGTLVQGWWWTLALRRGRLEDSLIGAAWHHLQRHARQLPAALLQLRPALAAVARSSGSRTQQQGLDQALVQHFGLHEAWFESLHALAAADERDPGTLAADWVALCRQIAIDPTPLRHAPGTQTASGADVRRAPVAGQAAAVDEPANGDRLHRAAGDRAAWPVAAAAAARPRSRPAPRRLREGQGASSNADQRIADESRAIGAGLALLPAPGTPARPEDTGHADRPEALFAKTGESIPGAPSRHEPSPVFRHSTPAPTPGGLPQPAAALRRPSPTPSLLHSRYAGLLLLLNAALALGLYGDFSQPRLLGLPLHPWHWLWLAARQLHRPAVKQDPLMRWLHAAGGVDTATALAAWRHDALTLRPWSHDTRPWILLQHAQQAAVVLRHPAGFTVARLASAHELPALWAQLELPPPTLLRRWRVQVHQPRDPLHDLWPCLWARVALALHGSTVPARSAKALARGASAQAGRVEISATRVRAAYALAQWPLALRLAGLDRNPGWIPAAGCELVFDFE